jgi:predicted nucleic-acid-binding protein
MQSLQAESSSGTTVVVELGWVLRVACKLPRTTIAAHLRGLLDADHVMIENSDLVARALAAYEAGTADLSDYVILESARGASALPVLTFDERFARSSDVAAVPPLAPE